MIEIWRHDYRSENTSNDAFHFSVTNYNSIRISADGLSCVTKLVLFENRFKRSFRRLHPRNIRGCKEKRKTSLDFRL